MKWQAILSVILLRIKYDVAGIFAISKSSVLYKSDYFVISNRINIVIDFSDYFVNISE